MRILLLIFVFLLGFNQIQAQHSLRASMGIELANTPSLNDFINQSGLTEREGVSDFNTAIIFSGEFDYAMVEKFQIGLEAGYLLNSFNFTTDLGKFELDYNIISPSILGYYVLSGIGYNFKFGGGLGLRSVNVDLSLPGTNITTRYSNTGFGIIIRGEGNTLIGGNFYANIGADLRYDLNGIPKSNGSNLYNPISRVDVNLNSFSVGLHLGVSYIF